MTISNAQFAEWLARDVPRVVLYEQKFAYESGGNVAEGTVYLSSRPYRTSSVAYRAVISRLPTVVRSILNISRGGRSEVSVSDVEIDNSDDDMNFLRSLVIDGREGAFYLGAPMDTPGWTRSDFRLVMVTLAERVSAPDDTRLVVSLRDKRLLLDRQVMGSQVGGSGAESTRYLPLLWGSHFNVEALIYDAATLKYAVLSNYSGASVEDVRDSGVSLTGTSIQVSKSGAAELSVDAGTDVFNRTTHGLAVNDVLTFQDLLTGAYVNFAPFAGMTSGQQYWVTSIPTGNTFTLSLTKGGASIDVTSATYLGYLGADNGAIAVRRRYYDDLTNTGRIELSSTPDGRVTVDLAAAGSVTSPFAFAQDLIEDYGNVIAADIDSAAFTAADTALDAKIQLGYMNYSVRERGNLLEVLDDFMAMIFGWYGQNIAGKITCGVFDISGISAATAGHELTHGMVFEPGLSVESRAPGYSRVNVNNLRNHTIQGDGLATSVTVENRRLYAAPWGKVQRSTAPSGTAYSTNKPLYHKTMAEEGPAGTMDTSSTAYNNDTPLALGNYADELVADQAPIIEEIGASAGLEIYAWELGEVVNITYPRHGFDAGVKARIAEIALDLNEERISVKMLRQVAPNTTTASYP